MKQSVNGSWRTCAIDRLLYSDVVVPIEPILPWQPIKGFSQAIAELFVKTFPDRFTAKMLKMSRRGKIFVDYMRNGEGSTAVAPYSVRAKANAPVSTPIGWDEIEGDVRFDHFTVKNIPARLKLEARAVGGIFQNETNHRQGDDGSGRLH